MSNFFRRDSVGACAEIDLLFKPDRPRPIDTYIDYFGTPAPVSSPAWLHRLLDDLPCGERR